MTETEKWTNKQYSKLYNSIYSSSGYGKNFPLRKRYRIMKSLVEKYELTKTDEIICVSCGYGALVEYLHDHGYCVLATEICSYLLNNVLKRFRRKKVFMSEVAELGENVFQAVFCAEVLEHMSTEREVVEAVRDLFFISNKYVFASVTTDSSRHRGKQLHLTQKPISWWEKEFKKYGEILEQGPIKEKNGVAKSWWFWGRKL